MRERLNVVDCGDLVYAFGDAREMSEKLQAHAENCCLQASVCSLRRRPLRHAAVAARPRETFWQNGAGTF